MSRKFPVISHNLRGYDSHLIIEGISRFDEEVSVIPNGLEKCMTFTIDRNLIFIDSTQFMNCTLDSLVKNLSNNDFKYLPEDFLKLVKQKRVYPYDEYMDSFKKFSENKLPAKSKIFSSLKDVYISEKDYLKANNIWNVFKMNAMGDHHDLYLKTDVSLLADVFEKFINTCLDYYGLDPCHYFSSPGLSWDAMLKMTEIELDLIPNNDMHLFTGKGKRGDIPYIAKRHSKANNKYMECYDNSKECKYVTYLDANNLYGWAMSQYLPYSGFKWLNQKKISEFCLNSISESSSICYILEVDLEYPSELHELHNDYPLAPEKLEISQNILSKYCFNNANEHRIKIGGDNKLVPNLRNKSKYVVHYRNVHLYLSLGIKLSKVHRILKFKQSDWLKKYLDFNTDKRRKAANSFETDFFKLINNSVFGKTMEILRKIISGKVVNNAKDYKKHVSKPSFVSQKIFSKNFVAIHEMKPILTLNKSIYVGFSILDLQIINVRISLQIH